MGQAGSVLEEPLPESVPDQDAGTLRLKSAGLMAQRFAGLRVCTGPGGDLDAEFGVAEWQMRKAGQMEEVESFCTTPTKTANEWHDADYGVADVQFRRAAAAYGRAEVDQGKPCVAIPTTPTREPPIKQWTDCMYGVSDWQIQKAASSATSSALSSPAKAQQQAEVIPVSVPTTPRATGEVWRDSSFGMADWQAAQAAGAVIVAQPIYTPWGSPRPNEIPDFPPVFTPPVRGVVRAHSPEHLDTAVPTPPTASTAALHWREPTKMSMPDFAKEVEQAMRSTERSRSSGHKPCRMCGDMQQIRELCDEDGDEEAEMAEMEKTSMLY